MFQVFLRDLLLAQIEGTILPFKLAMRDMTTMGETVDFVVRMPTGIHELFIWC